MSNLHKEIPNLLKYREQFSDSKIFIVNRWVEYEEIQEILLKHDIDRFIFLDKYGSYVFDYFMGVINEKMKLGECPVMSQFILYLKNKNISADELFMLCSHLRKSMINYTHHASIANEKIFEEIIYLFDLNFRGLLKFYTDTIYQKDLEIDKNVKLLNQYREAIDKSAIVTKTDLKGVITYANDNLCDVSGYEHSELIGNAHNIMRHPDMKKSYFKNLWSTILSKKIFKGVVKNRSKSGTYFYLDTTIVPLLDQEGETGEYISIAYDVTSLIDAKQEAVAADSSKDYFLSNMSHEIRTPLNAILGFVSLMKDDRLTPTHHHKYLNTIFSSGETLLGIINNILDFSKLRSGEFSIEPVEFDLQYEFSQIVELFVPNAYSKSITFISYIDPLMPHSVNGDSLRLKQIIANFLSNAIKFTPRFGLIELEAEYKNGNIIVRVRDTGAGISNSKQEEIFEPFTQFQEVVSGTGLGLFICKKLAQHMGGEITIKSEEGSGSEFTLVVPAKIIKDIDLDSISSIKDLRMAFLNYNETDKKYRSLQRYFSSLNIDVDKIDHIEHYKYDLIFFNSQELKNSELEEIEESSETFVALIDGLHNPYEDIEKITPLYLPLYLFKIDSTVLDSLDFNKDHESTMAENKIFRFNAKVLVAEDNEANKELIKTILERYGIVTNIVSNGLEAFKLCKEREFDLILMDEQMPVMNGTEATQKIMESQKKRSAVKTPIVSLTANMIKGAKERALMSGYDEFLGKPIVIKELEVILQKYLKEDERSQIELISTNKKALVEGVDLDYLKEELQLDFDDLITLLKIFKTKSSSILAQLKVAQKDNDIKALSKLIHSIKGSSANFRLESIKEICLEIDYAIKSENRSYDFKEAIDMLEIECDKIVIL